MVLPITKGLLFMGNTWEKRKDGEENGGNWVCVESVENSFLDESSNPFRLHNLCTCLIIRAELCSALPLSPFNIILQCIRWANLSDQQISLLHKLNELRLGPRLLILCHHPIPFHSIRSHPLLLRLPVSYALQKTIITQPLFVWCCLELGNWFQGSSFNTDVIIIIYPHSDKFSSDTYLFYYVLEECWANRTKPRHKMRAE